MGRFLEGLKNTAVGLGAFAVCGLIFAGTIKITHWFGMLLAYIFKISIEITYSPITGTVRGTFGRELMLGVAGYAVIGFIVYFLQLARWIGEDINDKT